MKKINKTRLKKTIPKIKRQLAKCQTMERFMQLHKRYTKLEYLLNQNCNKNPMFTIEKFVVKSPTYLMPYVGVWHEQRERRRAMIVSHPTFCCPKTDLVLDMDKSFILNGQILHFLAFDKLTNEEKLQVDLGE